jgi:competence protein ComEC
MVLGNRRSIPTEITDNFRQAGTSHIIAISGMHITIIAGLLMQIGIGIGIPRNKTFYLAAVVLGMYVALVGMPASAIRAATMGLLVLFSQIIGRLSRSINPLLFVASVMILINPKVLLSDVGFQLSFLAVIGIMYLSPFLQRLFKWLPELFQIRNSVSMTMAAYLTTLPLIIFSFKQISLVAIMVNVLVLPVVPLIMITGLLTGIAGSLFIPLGETLGWLVWLLLSYAMKMINFFVQFDYASFVVEEVSCLVLIVGYLVIALGIWIISKNKKPATTPS